MYVKSLECGKAMLQGDYEITIDSDDDVSVEYMNFDLQL